MRSTPDTPSVARPVGEEPGAHGPRHPAEALTGCRVVRRGSGWATATMPVPTLRAGEEGTIGWMGALADVSAAQALVSHLPDGYGLRTANLRLDRLDGLPSAGSIATGHGESSGTVTRSGLSRSTLKDRDGRAFAICTGRFVAVPTVGVTTPPTGTDQHHAYRPDWLHEAIGVRDARAEADKITLTIRPSSSVCNHLGIVHGGLHITLIDHVMCGVLSSTRPGHYELLDLSLVYHRPASLLAEPDLVLQAVIDRQGRRITTVTASITSRSGRILTTAHGTFMPDGNV